MNVFMYTNSDPVVVTPSGLTELVRGCEQQLLEQVSPLVREQDVTLDLRSVERIDAAGVTALIKLYGYAREAGRHFAVQNVSAHVREILSLLGLEPVLLSHDAVRASHSAACFEMPAA